jgi:S-adenosylmethionine:tRNA ribosyltransferase-isomerase
MRTSDFDFELPPERIAQVPAPSRDASRLLILHRDSGSTEHRRFREIIDYLRAGDVLVLNNSRVIPARLRAVNARGGGQVEILLLEENAVNDWWCLLRPGKRARLGTRLVVNGAKGRPSGVQAAVLDINGEGHRRLQFAGTPDVSELLESLGEVPLPPYIHRADGGPTEEDKQRYQTVFAEMPGSVAAPTAGLHFTGELLDAIRSRGVRVCSVTLHVGLATFAPVKAETIDTHTLHEERYEVTEETAGAVNRAVEAGDRVVAVGTTTVRVLESVAALHEGRLVPGGGRTRIFIHPPFPFRIVGGLLTNFHLPRSTLLMLVSAFAAPNETRGRETILSAYAVAIREQYRFFSYGDAMLIV